MCLTAHKSLKLSNTTKASHKARQYFTSLVTFTHKGKFGSSEGLMVVVYEWRAIAPAKSMTERERGDTY